MSGYKRLAGKLIGLVAVILVVMSALPVAAESAMVELDSRELKLLLNADLWSLNRWDGYDVCWDTVKELAKEVDVGVIEAEDPFDEGARKVMYLDTDSEELGKNNLTLRLRIKMKDGKFQDKVDLNLKYRVPGADAVPSDAVTVAPGIECEYSYEEDVVGFVDGVVGKNESSASLGVTIKGVPEIELAGNTLGTYAKYYPSLAELGISLDSEMQMIAGIEVMEYKVTPGELDFGQGMISEVDISVWYDLDSDQIITMELSYGSDLGPDAPAEAVDKAVEFFNALQKEMNERKFLVPGGTKTQLLRDYAE
ncbi:MAG: hypothetical protein QM391_02205 [Bacillota bacterium]|jgi:hypothetical protein|nr:hypothetical protein [Bacillota bacterium]NLD13330.1 hypothetical protein [Bacillota bacterium]HCD41756.1 hypothetical protein [Bacillota bacterium]HOB89531.1 hypothetical protein [Bacillota bacterium]HOJ58568.1 hypothetical protein [Bacillota bacterium]